MGVAHSGCGVRHRCRGVAGFGWTDGARLRIELHHNQVTNCQLHRGTTVRRQCGGATRPPSLAVSLSHYSVDIMLSNWHDQDVIVTESAGMQQQVDASVVTAL